MGYGLSGADLPERVGRPVGIVSGKGAEVGSVGRGQRTRQFPDAAHHGRTAALTHNLIPARKMHCRPHSDTTTSRALMCQLV